MRALLAALTSLILTGCDGAYESLISSYGVKSISKPTTSSQTSLTITGPQHKGAQLFRNIVAITALEHGVGIEVSGVFTRAIFIPTTDIAACAMTCFGTKDRRIDFVVPSKGSILSLPTSPALENWCWTHKKQIFPGVLQRAWEYEGSEFPSYDASDPQFASRDAYDKQLFQSCLGY